MQFCQNMHVLLKALTVVTLTATIVIPAAAQDYPTRTVRIVVPFTPGGGTDVVARLLAQKMTTSMGQQFVVDNRPGAGGNLGAELVAKAASDGHTILMVSSSYAVNATLYQLAFDPVKDLLPVVHAASVPFVLVAHPSLPANNIPQLVTLARQKPGQINYASSGNGSSPHLAGELLAMSTNIRLVHIPYRGGTPGMMDVIAGQAHLLFSTIIQALPHIRNGKLKGIAIGSPKRSPVLPEVATIDESGVPGYDVTNWFGALVPGQTSPKIVARINSEMVQHLQSADVKSVLSAQGAELAGSTPAEFEKLIRGDIEKFGRVVKAAKIRID
jgi:tripartite-type tricarboxylate transporter receptor subunit TctC